MEKHITAEPEPSFDNQPTPITVIYQIQKIADQT